MLKKKEISKLVPLKKKNTSQVGAISLNDIGHFLATAQDSGDGM